jgi:hypothetical protein
MGSDARSFEYGHKTQSFMEIPELQRVGRAAAMDRAIAINSDVTLSSVYRTTLLPFRQGESLTQWRSLLPRPNLCTYPA